MADGLEWPEVVMRRVAKPARGIRGGARYDEDVAIRKNPRDGGDDGWS